MVDFENLIRRIKSAKNNSDDDWLQIEKDIHIFLKEEHPEEEKKAFVPLGYLEMVSMICDGIERKRGMK